MTGQSRSEISAMLESRGLSPVHRLGQHFLADANIVDKIVRVAEIVPGDHVVEVGAGTGSLTTAIAAAGATVIAYEIDHGLSALLDEVTDGLDVEVRERDIMDVDLGEDLDGAWTWKMVANLPYNVGTPLVLDTMRKHAHVGLFVVMVQREVAERFCADPGGKDYGLPSVIAQLYTEPRIEFVVPPQVFFPAPRVDSAVLVMPRKPAAENAGRAVELAAAAFGQRRKMLRRSLAAHLEDSTAYLESRMIDPTARAEDLSPEDYLRLAS